MWVSSFRSSKKLPWTYDTSFALTENPPSEGGIWVRPAPSVWTTTMRTVAGQGIFGDSASSSLNDSISLLNPARFALRRTQQITAVACVLGSFDAAAEMEVHMLSSYDDTHILTYEADMSCGGSGLVAIEKWAGPQIPPTEVTKTGGTTGAFNTPYANNDVYFFEALDLNGDGSRILFTVKQNGAIILTAEDSTAIKIGGTNPYTGNSCGVGADDCSTGNTNVGFKRFSLVTL